jgi:hypothetical protein
MRSRGNAIVSIAACLAVLAGCTAGQSRGDAVLATVPTTTVTAAATPVDPAVEEVIAGAGMTDQGRRLFLLARPQIEDPTGLAESCAGLNSGSEEEEGASHTYGCLSGGRMHLRTFSAPEMRDLIYVVAAHELLHVVWFRLPAADRTRLEGELTAARSANATLEERLEVYTEAGQDSPDEVHALLGSEFRNLSAALEAHYARYFDRGRVLAAYERTLGAREEELRSLRASVDQSEAQLLSLEARMDAQRAAGDISGFNANVARFNAMVAAHNRAVRELNQRVADYRRLLAA